MAVRDRPKDGVYVLTRVALFVIATFVWSAPLVAKTFLWRSFPPDCSHTTISEFERELERITAASGEFAWAGDGTTTSPVVNGTLIEVTLLGHCSGRRHASAGTGALGWSEVSDGKVLPFIRLDCDRIGALIRPVLKGKGSSSRELLMGRALARVLAHELRHVLSDQTDHGFTLVSKVSLSREELTQARAEFDPNDFSLRDQPDDEPVPSVPNGESKPGQELPTSFVSGAGR